MICPEGRWCRERVNFHIAAVGGAVENEEEFSRVGDVDDVADVVVVVDLNDADVVEGEVVPSAEEVETEG